MPHLRPKVSVLHCRTHLYFDPLPGRGVRVPPLAEDLVREASRTPFPATSWKAELPGLSAIGRREYLVLDHIGREKEMKVRSDLLLDAGIPRHLPLQRIYVL